MTENEAIKELKDIHKQYVGGTEECEIIAGSITMSIKALEEIQQYRAIGTVEELKSMKENGAFTGVELAQLAAMQMRLKEYSAIGTIEEFKALKEKSVAKKPYIQQIVKDFREHDCYECPNCDCFVGYVSECQEEHYQDIYCPNCGQKLDWQ